MLLGVLFHDLGKLRELGAMPANDYTLEGRLIGHVVIGRDLLRERCAAIPGFPEDLRLLLEHLVLSHQGKKEFSSPVEPMTPEAVALHFIDDLDSKLNQLRAAREARRACSTTAASARFVYLPAPEGPPPRSRPSPPPCFPSSRASSASGLAKIRRAPVPPILALPAARPLPAPSRASWSGRRRSRSPPPAAPDPGPAAVHRRRFTSASGRASSRPPRR